jgi:hypothetical protein
MASQWGVRQHPDEHLLPHDNDELAFAGAGSRSLAVGPVRPLSHLSLPVQRHLFLSAICSGLPRWPMCRPIFFSRRRIGQNNETPQGYGIGSRRDPWSRHLLLFVGHRVCPPEEVESQPEVYDFMS